MSNVKVIELTNDDLKLEENEHHLKQLSEIWVPVTKVMGDPVTRTLTDFSRFLNKFPGTFFCAYEDDQMTGFMKCIPFVNNIPMYNVNWIHVRKGMFSVVDYSKPNHPWVHIMNHMLTKMENQGYYNWYNIQANRPAAQKKYKEHTDLMRFCDVGWDNERQQYRYHRYPAHIVKPGETSNIEAYQRLLGPVPWQHEVIIYQWVLKSEYRREFDTVKDFWITE